MLKRLLILLLAFILPVSALAEGLDNELSAIFHRYKAVGGVVVAAKDGEIVYHFDYGYASKKGKLPVTADTYFKTASVTKLISGLRVLQLVEEGKLSLDAPIGGYLGYTVENPRHPGVAVTLRQIMSHTSSICGSYTSSLTLENLLARSDRWKSWKPGTRYAYSNLGAGTMGALMEAVTGQDVNTCVKEGVFAPLGIDAGYRVHLLEHPDSAALRYNAEGKLARSSTFYLTEAWEPYALPERHYTQTIGDMWIRGDDLCRLGMMLAAGGELDGVRVLSEDTVALMTSSQQGLGGITANPPYGLCVERVTSLVDGKTLYGHQGLSDGIVCNLYWEPESRFVFALITNGSSTAQENHICKLSRRAFAAVWEAYGAE